MMRINLLASMGLACFVAALGGCDFESGLADALAHQGHNNPPAQACTENTDILASGNWKAANATETLWLERSAKSCDVSGGVYAASDLGLDKTPGTADDSLTVPSPVSPGSVVRQSPCNTETGKCCISGTTHLWPISDDGVTIDYSASVWGSILAIDLNASTDGKKLPYAGPAKGFNVELSGHLEQEVRIAYRQAQGNEYTPFVSASLGKNAVLFTDVECPANWGDEWIANCVAGGKPVTIEIQLAGGDYPGPYELCIDRITPIL
jgi:hypothetical protein